MPTTTGDDNRDGTAPRVSASSGLNISLVLDRITTFAGESVAVQRDLAEKKKRIEELEEQLAQAQAQSTGQG